MKRHRGRAGIDWNSQPLGKIPDLQIAKALGVNVSTVQRVRVRMGIRVAPHRSRARRQSRIQWDDQPLGLVPDGRLARMIGCSAPAVRTARVKRNIASASIAYRDKFASAAWGSARLGEESDLAIATRLGVSAAAVRGRRLRLGITARRRDSCPCGVPIAGKRQLYCSPRCVAATAKAGRAAPRWAKDFQSVKAAINNALKGR